MHHLMMLALPSILELPLPLKGVCLDWDVIARLQTYRAYFPAVVLFLSLSLCCRLGLGFLKGSLHSVSDSGYVFIHMLGGGATLGDLCAP